jgi:hypothetical protein
MDIEAFVLDKGIEPKDKTETICQWLLDKKMAAEELVAFAENVIDPSKAICIEALEYATKQHPSICDEDCFLFLTNALRSKSPRVKWEAARVIGNTAHLYPQKLDEAIIGLLLNSEHEGTVVRWSAAYALGEILKINSTHQKKLLQAIEAIVLREEKISIRKIYLAAIKKSLL